MEIDIATIVILMTVFMVLLWLIHKFLMDITSEKIGSFIDRVLKSNLISQKNDDIFKNHLGLDSEKLRSYVKIGRELFD